MVVGRCPGLSTQHHRLTQTKTPAQAHRTMHYMHIRNMYVQREVEVHYNMIYMYESSNTITDGCSTAR